MIPKKTIIALLLIFTSFSLFALGVKGVDPCTTSRISLKLCSSITRTDEIERHVVNVLKNFNSYPDGYNVDPFPYLTVHKIQVAEYQNQSNLFIARKPKPETKMIVIIAQ